MTQLQMATQKKISPEIRQAAMNEQMSAEQMLEKVASGEVVIPHNKNRQALPTAIGSKTQTKINANIGTSDLSSDLGREIQKIELISVYGAHSVMDLSTGKDLRQIRETLLQNSPLIFGTVPIYAVASLLESREKSILDFEPEMLFDELEMQAEQGVDFFTVHAGINRWSLDAIGGRGRKLGIVSRGGSLLKRWMLHTGKENPLYEQFDRLLDICRKHDVTLSLGDGFRPGAIHDSTDAIQISELIVLGELVQRARAGGVQVMVEGPGHMALAEIEANVLLEKKLCANAPFYVLGPLPTDFACGYDHITGAIGGAIAAAAGADFLCYVTPAEHLCLPDLEDVKQGVIASRIAAHIADIAKGFPGAAEIDDTIAKARREMDWENVFRYSVDPGLARRRKSETSSDLNDRCTMCGNLCAIKTDKENICE
jgi:phosphomethylpyrimidine synthase